MAPQAYHLAHDAYVCLAGDLLVFSNLQDDKYCCLDRANTRAALHTFPNFQAQDNTLCTDHHASDDNRTELVLRALFDKGLLVDGRASGKAFSPIRIPAPMTSTGSSRQFLDLRSHIGHCASFLLATFKASGKLRLQSLHRTIRGVEKRKRLFADSSPLDTDALRKLTAIFHLLRPYYPRRYLCRFDSLALVEFLARYGQHPTWVFGVKSQPFGAHCWIQDGGCVLNDSVDYVRRFTPIMAF